MRIFILFLRKIYVFVIFLVLEVAAINHYMHSTSYTRARMLTATNSVVGGVYRRVAGVGGYFGLRRENGQLMERMAELSNELEVYRKNMPELDVTTLRAEGEVGEYIYATASVINNTLTRPENFFTIDKGLRHGAEPDMAVVTPEGTLVGYLLECGENLSVGMSLLNTQFQTSGTINGKEYLGSVFWDGRSSRYATLTEIEKYGDIQVGDTVVTTDYSSRFPPGVVIGTVESFETKQQAYIEAQVKLATHFSSLKHVLLVRYHHIVERRLLEESAAN